MAGLQELGCSFITVHDLCGMAVKRTSELKRIVDRVDKVAVIACHPRAVKWLFSMAGIKWDTEKLHVINARNEKAENIIGNIRSWGLPGRDAGGNVTIEGGDGQWDPWFPVIDYERCENCKQCLSFCLFGVYMADENDKVEVRNPQNCKNNCPACARICPKAAIIFPKYTEVPINGSEIGNEEILREKIKVNVDEILGDDIYAALAERRKKAKKLLIKKSGTEQAELERKKFLEQE